MIDTDLLYTQDYQVRAYEIDAQQRMTVPALSRLMQEAALQNVIQIGMSYWDLEAHHISWVLTRQQLQVQRLPMLNEPIRINTYPAGFLRAFALRDFWVETQDGEPLAHSASTWLLMDTRTRRMASPPDFVLAFNKRMPPRDQCLPRITGQVAKLEKADYQANYTVHWHDLDFNQHLNNTLYIQWMMDPVPSAVLAERQLAFLDIEYRAESKLADELQAEVQEMETDTYCHRILRPADGKVLANAYTRWQ
ncbi:MAG: thioesterase [Phaeodactylibacter sp.]|uniref:acyl-[acyl-carrier-protein] thioesterase n=1 Tax=Phaeodactylibacter sp. TaxID=1940289 RepID=UPI0032ECA271